MSGRQPKRYFDRTRNLYFTWNQREDKFVYEDQSTRPRGANEDPESLAAIPSTPRQFEEPVYNEYTASSAARDRATSSSSQPPSLDEQVFSRFDSLTLDRTRAQQSGDLRRVDRSNDTPYQGQGQSETSAGTQIARSSSTYVGSSGGASRSQRLPAAQLEAQEAARRQSFTPRQYATTEGLRVSETYNPRIDVRMRFASRNDNPVDRITDPVLLRSGIRAQGMLIGNPSSREGEAERLYNSFQVRAHGFFVVGRVFLTLWVEPAGTTAVTSLERNDYIPGRFQDEFIYSKVRRFVVVRQSGSYCSAIPIMTYGGRGTSKRGVNKSEHVIIHTGARAPPPLASESPARGESGMRPYPIRVNADDPTDRLDEVSRLDLGKVSTVQHNIKVKPFGNVHPSSVNALITQFQNVWGEGALIATSSETGASSSMPGPSRRSRRVSLSQGIYRTREEQPALNTPIQPIGRPPTQTGSAGAASRQTAVQPGLASGGSSVTSRAMSGASSATVRPRAGSGQQPGAGPSRRENEAPQESSSESSDEEEGSSAPASHTEATSAQNAYRRMRDHGLSRNEAQERLVRTLMSNTPGLSRNEAASRIRNYIAGQ